MNQRMGGGSYSQVYASWPKGNPQIQLACKVISKIELDRQVWVGLFLDCAEER